MIRYYYYKLCVVVFFIVVEPVSAEVKVILSKDDNLSVPKLFMDVALEDIEILLARQQVQHIVTYAHYFPI